MGPDEARVFTFSIDTGKAVHCWGVKEARLGLLAAGAQANLATEDWVQNHYQLIVWKLASMVRSFPLLYSEYWQPRKVAEQLQYRYII